MRLDFWPYRAAHMIRIYGLGRGAERTGIIYFNLLHRQIRHHRDIHVGRYHRDRLAGVLVEPVDPLVDAGETVRRGGARRACRGLRGIRERLGSRFVPLGGVKRKTV